MENSIEEIAQKYVGDGEGYLAACYDWKLDNGKLLEINEDEIEAKISQSRKFKESLGFGECNAKPF